MVIPPAMKMMLKKTHLIVEEQKIALSGFPVTINSAQ